MGARNARPSQQRRRRQCTLSSLLIVFSHPHNPLSNLLPPPTRAMGLLISTPLPLLPFLLTSLVAHPYLHLLQEALLV